MTRIYIYLAVYLATFILVILDSRTFAWLAFASFLVSTLAYTFSREGLPNADTLQYPEAFEYKAKRINVYGNGMLLTLIASSFLIYIGGFAGVNQSLIVFIVWPIVAYTSYRLMIYHSRQKYIYDLTDYISMMMKEKISTEYTRWIISVDNENDLEQKPGTFAKYNTNFLRETYKLKKSFTEALQTTISYSEIDAANSNK